MNVIIHHVNVICRLDILNMLGFDCENGVDEEDSEWVLNGRVFDDTSNAQFRDHSSSCAR